MFYLKVISTNNQHNKFHTLTAEQGLIWSSIASQNVTQYGQLWTNMWTKYGQIWTMLHNMDLLCKGVLQYLYIGKRQLYFIRYKFRDFILLHKIWRLKLFLAECNTPSPSPTPITTTSNSYNLHGSGKMLQNVTKTNIRLINS